MLAAVLSLAFGILEHGVPLVHGVDGSYVEKDLRLLGEANSSRGT